jgi:membrane-bound serine protease (ClpP class)
MTWIIFLFVLGLIMICLEIFLPGAIIGTIGGLALLSSVVLAFKQQGTVFGIWWLVGTLAVTLAGIYLAIKSFPRSRTGKILILQSSETGFVSGGEGLAVLVGKNGAAVSSLRPSGVAEIGGKRIDVVTGGEFIPAGKKITVVAVEGSRVMVKEISY